MKKIISMSILIILFVGVMTMYGCSGREKDDSSVGDSAGKDTLMYSYKEFELNKGGDDRIVNSYFKGTDFYYISYGQPDLDDDAAWTAWEEKGYPGSLHRYKTDSGEDIVLCEVKEVPGICALYVTEQNQLKYILRDDINEVYRLVTIMPDGTEVSAVSLSDNLAASLEEADRIDYIKFGNDGQIYFLYNSFEGKNKYIVRCDMEGNVTGSVKVDEGRDINGIFFDNDNKLAVETNKTEGLEYIYVDFDKGECRDAVAVMNEDGSYMFSNESEGSGGGVSSRIYNGIGEVSCYLRDVTGLCSYNAEEQCVTYLFDWTKTGIIGGFVDNIIPMEDGRIFCECWDRGTERTYGIIEKLEEGTERKVIKCAALSMDSDYRHQLEQNIINYNKSSSDYFVELVSYDKSASPIDAFAKDVIAGNIPDVLDISGVDVKSYINKGFFEDLSPYMEKDDVFNKDYYVDGLYDAIAVDGKQYYAVKSFELETIAAKASDTEKYKDGWTVNDMVEYFGSKPEETMLYMEETKNELFRILIAPFIDDYIDWATGKVNFDSDEFRAAAEFCSKFPSNSEIWPDYGEVNKKIHEGKILLNNVFISAQLDDMCMNKALFDDDIRYIGYPTAGKKRACIIPSSSSLAITSSSKEKDAAWDFVKNVITEDSYKNIGIRDKEGFEYDLPSGKKHFDKIAKRLSAAEEYTEEDGTVVKPKSGTSSMNDFEYTTGTCSEEDINIIRELIKNAVIKTDNSAVLSIVESVMNDYFSGGKTLDELVSVLQDRVGKYVNENK